METVWIQNTQEMWLQNHTQWFQVDSVNNNEVREPIDYYHFFFSLTDDSINGAVYPMEPYCSFGVVIN